ncbi:DUF2190 family protein [Pandoraea commovens]|uniref:DUF2190 family protein n=1 Tax=Pandoraea commovens TaxID=2508289 RepID=A0ABY5QJB8_9BURK|nr:DUF2190 family protein [Pandoraea commovens]UVA80463.1 DUF2190 family protein [Pandoraea commovens]
MQNAIQRGSTLTLAVAAAVVSGQAVLIGKIFAVAVTNVAAGQSGEFQREGVFELPVNAPDQVAQGVPLYWDADNKRLTITAQGNTRVGVATEAKAAGGATVSLLIDAVIS